MSKSNNASLVQSSVDVQKTTSPIPATSKPSEEFPLDEKAWLERINKNMKRMSTDEEYRRSIAKDLS